MPEHAKPLSAKATADHHPPPSQAATSVISKKISSPKMITVLLIRRASRLHISRPNTIRVKKAESTIPACTTEIPLASFMKVTDRNMIPNCAPMVIIELTRKAGEAAPAPKPAKEAKPVQPEAPKAEAPKVEEAPVEAPQAEEVVEEAVVEEVVEEAPAEEAPAEEAAAEEAPEAAATPEADEAEKKSE